MKNISLLPILMALSLCGLVISACNATPTAIDPQRVDQSFITGQPCKAPCWYGLEPDKSTETEALSKLKELSFVDQTNIKKYEHVAFFTYSGGSEIMFGCAFPRGSTCGTILSEEGIVKYISLAVYYPLELKSVIDQLGAPAFLVPIPYTPHGEGCKVSFVWPQQRTAVIYADAKSEQVCEDVKKGTGLRADLLISMVNYVSEDIGLGEPCPQSMCFNWPGLKEK